MHNEFKILEKTVGHFKSYANTRIDQIKLEAAERVSDLVSVLIARSLVTLVLSLSVVFGSIALAYAIGNYFTRTWLGFLIVSGVYLLLGWGIWAVRRKLIQIPIMNIIVTRLFKEENIENGKN